MNRIVIQREPFDICGIQRELLGEDPSIGALVTFTGLMRDFNAGAQVTKMVLEHYPGMTEKALDAILEEADRRWELKGIRVVHRIGELTPLEPIVLVAAASAHRGAAFQACEFVIDYLKTQAPFWKKEITPRGEHWVEARSSDSHAQRRWENGD